MEFDAYLLELEDTSTPLKVSRLVTLSRLSPEEAQKFKEAWPRVETRRRRRALQELLELVEDNVELNFDDVFLSALKDTDAEVRMSAVRGLWECDDPEVITPLVGLLEGDEDVRVRSEAALALGRFVLLAEYGQLRERYFERVAEGLRRKLQETGEAEEVRGRALESIGFHDDAWVRQAISEAYESGRHRMKVSAVQAMGRSCEGRWLPLLVRELSNEDSELRYEAALACGSLGDEQAVRHLAPLLGDSDSEVQMATISALGEIGSREAKELLMDLLAEGGAEVREAATEALAEIEFSEDPLSFRYRL